MQMTQIDQASVAAVQSVLRASRVDVFVVGRVALEERLSLMFVADEARLRSRPGFSFGGLDERYVVQGGLAEAELNGLFRTAAGRRTELDVLAAVGQWAEGRSVAGLSAVPPVVHKELDVPLSVAGLTRIAQAMRSGLVRAYGEAAGARVVAESMVSPVVATTGGRRV